jgi:hypothetical protein
MGLALLVNAMDDRALRWIEIEPDNIAPLLEEEWIGRELESLRAMWLGGSHPIVVCPSIPRDERGTAK